MPSVSAPNTSSDEAPGGDSGVAPSRRLSSPVNRPLGMILRAVLRALLRPIFRWRGFAIVGAEHWPRGPRPWIVVANHAAFIDSVYLILALPVQCTICGAKPRLFRNWRLRALMALANILKVENHEQFLADCGYLLTAGKVLLIYPEMGRYADGMGEFKTWAAEVALAHEAMVVPCYLYGTTRGQRGPVQLRVGQPLASAEQPPPNAVELTRDMRSAIEELAEETHSAEAGR